MISIEDNSLGIGTRERKTEEAINWTGLVEKHPFSDVRVSGDGQDIRSVTPVPGNSPTAKEPNDSTEIEPQISRDLPSSGGAEETEVKTPQRIKPTWPKIYVVSEGDYLAGIAKKFYGPEEGNRKININRIFEANRKLLRLPDEIYVGQKLIIPPPSNLTLDKNKIGGVLSSTLFEKVKSIGRKHLSMDGRAAKQGGWYNVREGDSLWKIAAEQLGNGSRYTEISELNADILDDEDFIPVGLRLRLPAR